MPFAKLSAWATISCLMHKRRGYFVGKCRACTAKNTPNSAMSGCIKTRDPIRNHINKLSDCIHGSLVGGWDEGKETDGGGGGDNGNGGQ